MGTSLHVFDLDGPLAETWSTQLLPGVAERIPQLEGRFAVATNQAGVVWNAVEGDPYPTPSEVGNRLVGLRRSCSLRIPLGLDVLLHRVRKRLTRRLL